jgi:uncharacterized membrane protein
VIDSRVASLGGPRPKKPAPAGGGTTTFHSSYNDGARRMKGNRWRSVSRAVLAVFFIGAGVLHFVRPEFYLRIMPPYLPWHLELVYLSGACEVAGGVGVLIPALRRAAGWGLIALLIAVFPANLQMAVNHLEADGLTLFGWLLLARLPLQLVLIWWVYRCTRGA